jgi:hypothetical protein
LVWTVLDAVGELDLSAFYAAYRSDGHGARPMSREGWWYAYARESVGARDRAGVHRGRRLSRRGRQPGARSLDDRRVSLSAEQALGEVFSRVLGLPFTRDRW